LEIQMLALLVVLIVVVGPFIALFWVLDHLLD
jgi:hypothetical protein